MPVSSHLVRTPHSVRLLYRRLRARATSGTRQMGKWSRLCKLVMFRRHEGAPRLSQPTKYTPDSWWTTPTSMSLRRTKKSSTNPASQNDHASVQTTEYTLEFGGTLGALGIVVGLPFVCLALAGFCNDTSGCPGLFSVQEIFSIRATVGLFAYFGLLLLLYVVLPGQDCDGAVLPSGKRLSYRLNCESTHTLIA